MAPVGEVTDSCHAGSLLLQLNEQRLRGQFCDITVIAEETKFQAHKNVLAASSLYFKEVLLEDSHLPVPSLAAAKELGAAGRRLGISRLENLD
uniref:BTB domain-containing protein n=1 Tax=Varanus komodoensis TaxID=61221 RepID=A0A8D2LZE9_VARKO